MLICFSGNIVYLKSLSYWPLSTTLTLTVHFCLFQERGTFLSRYSQLSNFLFYVHHGHINLKYSKKRDTYVVIWLKSEQRLSTYDGFLSIFVQLQQRLLCFLHLSPAAHCLLGLCSSLTVVLLFEVLLWEVLLLLLRLVVLHTLCIEYCTSSGSLPSTLLQKFFWSSDINRNGIDWLRYELYNAMYMFFIPLQLPTVCLKRIWEEEREGPELGVQ